MGRRASGLALAALAALGAPLRAQTPAPPTSETWLVAIPAGLDTTWYRFRLRLTRDSVVGTDAAGLPLAGRRRGDSLDFTVARPSDSARVHFTGVLHGGVIRGVRVAPPRGGMPAPDSMAFVAMPEPRPSRVPRRQAFSPTTFHRWFSGVVAPAVRLVPGDTVRTWSVDAGGFDSAGAARSPGGNPLTGPFFVEGALPGDVLAVRLLRVRLNRDMARSGSRIVPNALGADHVRGLREISGAPTIWRLDRARGVVTLERPTPAFRSLALPLRPMLGCVGVAPPMGQVIRTSDSGPFGGNMDYNEIREGTTVYLPVFQRGAMLFLGDGHALQGDGELTGDALETSMDIEFSIALLPRKAIGAPRAENDEFLMAIGIAGSLDEALRRATTELSRWLEADHRLGDTERALLLGAAVRYDVADLVGTQVSVVAKVPRSLMRQLQSGAGR